MKQANVFVNGVLAGRLEELERGGKYRFIYLDGYQGDSISLEMPRGIQVWEFDRLPPFFDGVLPEGMMLEALLKLKKIDREDYMSQLIAVGGDLVGNVTIKEVL
jgi:serine/threonine-protein kinase HipA